MKTLISPRLATLVALTSMSLSLPSLAAAPAFGDDLAFLKKHTSAVVLSNSAGAQVVVAPAWQGRVMTSSADGAGGLSFGWVNRELIASGELKPHINVFGGEDRFWLGPEGGQFSIFFAPKAAFDLDHWQTPAVIDTEAYAVAEQHPDRVVCRKAFGLTNYSGTTFELAVTREVRLLDPAVTLRELGAKTAPGLKAVSYESVNTVQNTGKQAWTKDTGLLSIWILGMFNAAPSSAIVVPFNPGSEQALGPAVNDSYFGKVPADRLVVDAQRGVLFFRADANARGKIGIAPRRAKSVLGSYDSAQGVLTVVDFTLPKGATDYVNSMWELQKEPFAGDVVNSYNDGPPKPGAAQMGRFYELETSSPALALKPGASATHRHRTSHFQGERAQLEAIAQTTLGVSLKDIEGAFRP